MYPKNVVSDTFSELAEMLLERGCVYEMLRRLFLFGPTVGLVTELIELSSAYQEEDAVECPAGEREWVGFLQTLQPDLAEALVQKLQPEFTRLFIGPRHLPAPPYESVYRSAERVLMQAITIEVREKYRDAGLEVKNLNHEPDDHIGLELEFMYYLNRKALEALTRGDVPAMLAALDAQSRFLTGHLSQWVSTFCDDIAGNTCQEFFRYMAEFLKGFIMEDCEQVRRFI
ncbi:molecular chaperone [Sporomusa sp. KB1]|jgi:TorA maturation chaperone TorD|uniref:TorD/DmsD family molecular chaperone n=1 Tax=Sporomusa sp. KB1 TaxID=943346 RepID=UPI00119D3B3A|nr:molecular chaperone TorD family protein [Sporomusa sp. KB1]TWH49021.1 TorA maturation chaperone TorD [Sporomusa sp. KB1]